MSGPQPKTKAQEVSEILAKHKHKKYLSEFTHAKCRRLLLGDVSNKLSEHNEMLLCFVDLYGGDVRNAHSLAYGLLNKTQNISIMRNIHPILVDLGDFKSAAIAVERILSFCQKSNSDFLNILPYRIDLTIFLSGRADDPVFNSSYFQGICPDILAMVEVMDLFDLNGNNLILISDIVNKALLKFNQRIYEMRYSTADEELLIMFYLDAEFSDLQRINAEIFEESYKIGIHEDLAKISCYCVPYEGASE